MIEDGEYNRHDLYDLSSAPSYEFTYENDLIKFVHDPIIPFDDRYLKFSYKTAETSEPYLRTTQNKLCMLQ